MSGARAVLVCVTAVACGGGDGGGGGSSGSGYDYTSESAQLWTEMCAVCHGEAGEGGLGPTLIDSERSVAELREAIDARMPQSDPARCTGACAEALAEFVNEGLTSEALACDEVTPSPRRLRLLNRREYLATVADLFGDAGGAPAACADAAECGYREGCDAGQCAARACDAHTFVFDEGGQSYASVHVAGTFNDWASSVADGGWALARGAGGVWSGTFTVGEGTHNYKIVADGAWLADPRSPASVPDGFGGQNSVLSLSCAGGGGDAPPVVVDLPPATRPEGFAFDTHAGAGVVTAVHVDAYLEAAGSIAAQIASDVDAHVACDWRADPGGCAAVFVDDLGPRAFRRPLSSAERARYLALVEQAETFPDGVRAAVHALLVSPGFLYRTEIGEPTGEDTYRLTPHEIASALSYTLWGTMPDAALRAAAESGALADPAEIERQARRLLADPRSRAMVAEFALQWLGAEDIASVDKSPALFPGFTKATRAAMLEETRRFVADVVFEGSGAFGDLLTADYTIADAELAALYELPAPAGGGFARVPYERGRRAGVLGHGSVLGVYAHSDQTSPIRRGLLVRRRLLCQELPPPPPNAGGVPDVDPDATTRERFAQHTADPFCAGCHQYIDGVGFGFERFDPIGRWRDTENGDAIDASGDMNDVERLGSGTSGAYQTLPELAAQVASSEAATTCFARQYYRFGRGAADTLADRCARRWIHDRFAAAGFDVREMIVATFLSPDFAVRR